MAMAMTTNKALLRHRTGDYERQAEDWYVEPAWCWEVLFDVVRFPGGLILDPACGGGTGLERARARGYHAVGSDIVDRGCGACVADFLSPDYPLRDCAVATNPPYRLAEQFARRALEIEAPMVALLVPLPFLASQRRRPLFTTSPVSRVVVLSKRPSMPPGGLDLPPTGGKEDYCWVVWDRAHTEPPVISWGMPS